ncbi:hypothetical protein C5Y96_23325 [Blastopirellula marina]|uniref:Calx-beta domain-containing protein n=2 Tax=Pirellulales TaxID=2691354 RepID=A0A2S8F1E0_9BACT|nr:hypothetical protein C5Y96_23325 [Blastopirellula marina]
MLVGDLQFVSAADASVAPGAQLSVPVLYQTLDSNRDPSDQLASGLGLRLHFNSSLLTFDSLALGVTEDAFFNPNTVVAQDDINDFDNDPTTDKFLTAAWNDLIQADGGWPSASAQPVTLYTANFTAAGGFTGQTLINFSSSSTGTNPSNGQSFAFDSQSATISAQPPGTLSLAATDADKPEGDSATTNYTFTVTRSGSTTGAASVDYVVSGSGPNPADAADFGGTFPNGTVNFADGQATQLITIAVAGDTAIEENEGFTVTISNPAGATLGTATAVGTIQNDDVVATPLQFVSAADASVAPGAQLSVPVLYQTLDSNRDPSDQLASGLGLRLHFNSSLLTFDSLALGVTEDAFFNPNTVVAQDDINDFDNDPTTDKFLTAAWNDLIQADGGWPSASAQPVTLYTANFTAAGGFTGQTLINFSSSSTGTNPSNGQSFAFDSQSATISAQPPGTLSLAATDADKPEGDSATTNYTFTVTRSGSTTGAASVDYVVSGSGPNPADAADFGGTFPNGTVNFADGQATQLITIAVAGDTAIEENEGFTVTISNPAGATLGTATAVGTIQNDDTNTPPTITLIADVTIDEDTSTGNLAFTIGDQETAAGALVVTATSDNQLLVPNAKIALGGSGTDRTISVTPVANLSGTAEITVSVSDGTTVTVESFIVTVNAVNDPPSISAIADQVVFVGTATAALPFTLDDIDNAVGTLSVSAVSDNQTLIPNANIVLGGSGASRNIMVTPASGQTGTALITVTVGDGTDTTTEVFEVNVTADGLELHYVFTIPGIGTVTPGDNLVLPPNTEVIVSVVADKMPAINDLVSYQLNFQNSDLGSGGLTLSDWETDFPIVIDGNLLTPSDAFVAAANLQVQTTPVILGSFSLTTPAFSQGGPVEFLLTLDEVSGNEITSTTIGSLSGQSYFISDFGDVMIQFDVTPPQVVDVQLNVGLTDPANLPSGVQPTSWSTQRSDIRNIVVTFDEDISNITADDLVLTNLGINAPVDADQTISLTDGMLSVNGNSLTITFAPYQLPDGVFELQVLSTVTDLLGNDLDGDGNGEGGDAYSIAGNSTNKLFKLTGDYNGTGGVNILDSAVPIYWFGTTLPAAPEYVDLNKSGAINVLDFSGYIANFGKAVTYPAAQITPEVSGVPLLMEPLDTDLLYALLAEAVAAKNSVQSAIVNSAPLPGESFEPAHSVDQLAVMPVVFYSDPCKIIPNDNVGNAIPVVSPDLSLGDKMDFGERLIEDTADQNIAAIDESFRELSNDDDFIPDEFLCLDNDWILLSYASKKKSY